MSPPPDQNEGGLAGRRLAMSGKRITFFIVFYLCYAAFGIVRHHYEFSILVVVFGGALALNMLRPPTVVGAGGIRRPWRRPAIIHWSEVASIAAPQPGIVGVRLNLKSGKTVALKDIEMAKSHELATIGGKDVPAPPPLRVPARPPERRSDEAIAADVERRAKALSDEWRRLDAQSPHRPPSPPPARD